MGPSLLVEVDRSSWDDAELISFRVCHDEETTVFVSIYLLTTESCNPVLDCFDVGAGDVKVNAVLADLWLRYPLEAQSASAPDPLQPNVGTLPTYDWSPKKAGPEGRYEFRVGTVDDYVGNLSAGLCHHIVSIVCRRDRSRRSGVRAEVTQFAGYASFLSPDMCFRLDEPRSAFVRVVYIPFARRWQSTNALLRARMHQEGENVCRHPERDPDLENAGAR